MKFRAKETMLAFLEALEASGGYALPEPTLRTMLDARLRPPVGDAEYDDAKLALKQRDAIAVVEDEFDPELVKLTIKERGRAMLAAQ